MKRIVIVGNSAAGTAASEAIRKNDLESGITIISDEDYSAYCRCLISYFLAGEISEEKLSYRPKEFYSENNIELLLNKKVIRIDPKKNRVISEDVLSLQNKTGSKSQGLGKAQIDYDILLLANGASAKFPDIKGINKRGVFGLRTLKDSKEISSLIPISDTACILGGGLIGLKAAHSLKKQGLEVKVIIKSPQVLSQILDESSSLLFKQRLEENGIEVILEKDVVEILGNGDTKAVKLNSGKVIACQIVVVGKGVSPNTDIVKDSAIKLNQGILVDEYLRTNIPNVYAAGDVSETWDIALNKTQVNALWPNAVEQGRIAGENIAGLNTRYAGSLGMNSLEFFGLPVISMGITKHKDGFEELVWFDKKNNLYRKLMIKDNYIVGAIFVGKLENSGVFLRLIRERFEITKVKNCLLDESFDYTRIISLLPEIDNIYQFK